MRIITFYQNNTSKKEDTIITPYLYIVHVNGEDNLKLRGIGVSLFNHSISIGMAINLPKGYPFFTNITKNQTND